MDCKDCEDRLDYYLEGRLAAQELASLEQHLSACPDCARRLEELRKLKQGFAALAEMEAPPWFEQKVMQGVREAHEKPSFWHTLFYPLHVKVPVQALATILVVVIAVQVFRSMEPQVKDLVAPPPPGTIAEKSAGKAQEPLPERAKAAPVEIGKSFPSTFAETGKSAPPPAARKKEAEMQVKKDREADRALVRVAPSEAPRERVEQGKDHPAARAAPQALPAPAPAREPAYAPAPPPPSPEQAAERYQAMTGTPGASKDMMAGAAEKPRAELPAMLNLERPERKAVKAKAAKGAVSAYSAAQINIRLITGAPGKAAAAIRDEIDRLEGKDIIYIPSGETAYISADLPAEKLAELAAKLAGFGGVSGVPSRLPESGMVRISVSISPEN